MPEFMTVFKSEIAYSLLVIYFPVREENKSLLYTSEPKDLYLRDKWS